MILLKLICLLSMAAFVVAIIRRPVVVPVEVEEDEFASDDDYYFRTSDEGVRPGSYARGH